jgi:hypothetical protein
MISLTIYGEKKKGAAKNKKRNPRFLRQEIVRKAAGFRRLPLPALYRRTSWLLAFKLLSAASL